MLKQCHSVFRCTKVWQPKSNHLRRRVRWAPAHVLRSPGQSPPRCGVEEAGHSLDQRRPLSHWWWPCGGPRRGVRQGEDPWEWLWVLHLHCPSHGFSTGVEENHPSQEMWDLFKLTIQGHSKLHYIWLNLDFNGNQECTSVKTRRKEAPLTKNEEMSAESALSMYKQELSAAWGKLLKLMCLLKVPRSSKQAIVNFK